MRLVLLYNTHTLHKILFLHKSQKLFFLQNLQSLHHYMPDTNEDCRCKSCNKCKRCNINLLMSGTPWLPGLWGLMVKIYNINHQHTTPLNTKDLFYLKVTPPLQEAYTLIF